MAARLPLASGYDARLRRDGLPRVLRAAPAEPHRAAEPGIGPRAAESRPVLRIAALISAVALGGLAIFALALVALLRAP
jgi:hypothetical protein